MNCSVPSFSAFRARLISVLARAHGHKAVTTMGEAGNVTLLRRLSESSSLQPKPETRT